VSRGAALTGALLTTLATPATWPIALAVFLLRGGLLVVVVPIVVLPSPVGLGNLLAPALIAVVLQGPPVELVVLVGMVMAAVLAWFVIGGLGAAMLEAESAALVAGQWEDAPGSEAASDAGRAAVGHGRRRAVRILAARMVAHGPTAIAVVWGSVRLVDAAYRELTSPFDVSTPIVLRVLADAPDAVVAIVACWTAGEIVGALAARRIALDDLQVAGALRGAVATALRRPVAVLADFAVPLAVLALVLAPATIAASAAWGLVRAAARSRGDPFSATLAVVLFVTLWMVGLVLVAVAAAWRSAVWSIAHRELVVPAGRLGDEPIGNGVAGRHG
jgi:hypothetical protein